MFNYSPLDVTLLIGMCSVFVLGMALALVWLRHVIAQMEDATAALEILQQHPDLLHGARWAMLSGGVNVAAAHPTAHPRLMGRA